MRSQIPLLAISALVNASPPTLSGLTLLQSASRPGVTISYKRTYICETTPDVKSFSGYINFPSSTIPDVQGDDPYNISTFFWFVESRKNPKQAPLALYLAGGPGVSGLSGATYEGGPCIINPDSNSTELNPWSFNNNVNMLYIDQPVQAGFSYDALVNSIFNAFDDSIVPFDPKTPLGPGIFPGVLPSQNPNHTTATTSLSARALWHFMQVFVMEFPEYKTKNKRISLWTNSYGGFHGPGTIEYFERQNERIQEGFIGDKNVVKLPIDTLGITNGCVDLDVMASSWPDWAYNNTYGVEIIPAAAYENMTAALPECRTKLANCRKIANELDPDENGRNFEVNAVCTEAYGFCFGATQTPYLETGRSPFDLSRSMTDFFPPPYAIGYFNQQWVQQALGVPLNFTFSSNLVVQATLFPGGGTGDAARRNMSSINYIASKGIKIALVFGDRDFRCNWLGGEAVSLAMEYPKAERFRAAGYEGIKVNSSYQGGVVRQFNGISFSRVFDAGHAVMAYQPETVYQIFDRVMFNKDVATGKTRTPSPDCKNVKEYSTEGPASSASIKNTLPPPSINVCYVMNAKATCRADQTEALMNGTAVVKDFVVVSPK